MADIYRAYRMLNKVYDLGLSQVQLNAAEMMMKAAFASERGYKVDVENVDDWEFFAELRLRENRDARDLPEVEQDIDFFLKLHEINGEKQK